MEPLTDWFPRTKLHPPRLAHGYLPRQRLLTALQHAAAGKRLTLLSAPAGTGKTTLLASLCEADSGLRAGWLSLDAHDNDPARFISVLLAALDRVNHQYCENAQALLSSLVDPARALHRVIGVLINDILESEQVPIILALDDLHVIHEPRVFDALDYLLEHMPPTMHLAIATRHDPPIALARLRGRGQLVEFRLPDLNFTREEVAALAGQRLDLDLPEAGITALYARSGGWAVALRLLAASLSHTAAGTGLSSEPAESGETDLQLFQFLAEEVLHQQPEDLQQFLLQTSILPELTSDLCRAVTGREDASLILEDLHRRNLLLLTPVSETDGGKAVGPEPGWSTADRPSYRYHDLIAEFLRGQLARIHPRQASELHRLAAEAHSDPEQAVDHYVAAQLWDEAASAIELSGESLLHRGAVDILRRRIESIPDDVRDHHPWLDYYLGAIACQRGDYVQAQAPLENALRRFELLGDEVGQGESLMLLGDAASGLKDLPRASDLMDRALDYPLPAHRKAFLHISRVWVSVYEGAWDEVASGVSAAIEAGQQSGDPRALTGLALQLRAILIFTPEGIDSLEDYCQWVLSNYGEAAGPLQAGAHTLLGTIFLLRGRVEEAMRSTMRAQSMSGRLGGFIYMDLESALSRATILLLRRDYAGLEAAWRERSSLFEEDPVGRQWLPCHLLVMGRALWLQSRLAEAKGILDRMLSTEHANDLPENIVARSAMGAMLDMAQGRISSAEGTLREMSFLQRQIPYTQLFASARLLLAHLYLRSGRLEEAVAELRSCLSDYARLGMPGLLFIEGEIALPLLSLAVENKISVAMASRALETLQGAGRPRPIFVPTSGETLTPRQVEVLSLIVAGASNRAIARQLVISEWTVKSHVSEILAKLEVSSRAEAIVRSRELLLI